jgi:hypothetical protein
LSTSYRSPLRQGTNLSLMSKDHAQLGEVRGFTMDVTLQFRVVVRAETLSANFGLIPVQIYSFCILRGLPCTNDILVNTKPSLFTKYHTKTLCLKLVHFHFSTHYMVELLLVLLYCCKVKLKHIVH